MHPTRKHTTESANRPICAKWIASATGSPTSSGASNTAERIGTPRMARASSAAEARRIARGAGVRRRDVVGCALRDERENLPLPRAEGCERVGGEDAATSRDSQHPVGDARAEDGLAPSDALDGLP